MSFKAGKYLAVLALATAGCSSINLWPFGGDKEQVVSNSEPANATAYHCDGNKKIYVRSMNEGKAVWLILPDRQVRLDSTGPGKFSNGVSVLTVDGANASLTDGPSISYTNCSTSPKAAAKG